MERSQEREPLTVAEIMTTDVVNVSPEDTIRDLVETMTAAGISGVPVVAGDVVVGVVSVTDVLEFEASTPSVPSRREEHSEWGDWPEDAEEREEDVPGAFFYDLWDDVGADILERFSASEGPEWDLLQDHIVDEIMSRNLVTVPPDALVAEAARTMLDADVHRVLVTRNGQLLGILSSTDILRAVAQERVG